MGVGYGQGACQSPLVGKVALYNALSASACSFIENEKLCNPPFEVIRISKAIGSNCYAVVKLEVPMLSPFALVPFKESELLEVSNTAESTK